MSDLPPEIPESATYPEQGSVRSVGTILGAEVLVSDRVLPLEWRTEQRKVSDLVPMQSNPRQMTKDQVDALKTSLQRFNLVEIPAIDADNTILAGHQRVRILSLLGRGDEMIDVRVPNRKLTDEERNEYNIRSNANHGDWDWDTLANFEVDFLKGIGFDFKELKKGLSGIKTDVIEDEAPELPEAPTSTLGDLYVLGNHRLLCGDATKKEDVERLMDWQKADMVFTDPPYGVGYDGGVMSKREKLVGDDNTDLYDPCCQMAMDYTVDDAPMYLWHAGVKGIAAAAAAAAAGWEIRCEIVWNKNQAQYGALSAQYKQKHEPAYYCFKHGASARWAGPTTEVTVWDIDRSSKNEHHPTQKPVALAARAIKNHDVASVLDLFGGSGSTLIACEQLNRKCYMMEIDPRYVDVIVKRWETLTGQKAQKQ